MTKDKERNYYSSVTAELGKKMMKILILYDSLSFLWVFGFFKWSLPPVKAKSFSKATPEM